MYCVLMLFVATGLLATVPSSHGEDVNVNGLRGLAVPVSGKRRRGNGHGEGQPVILTIISHNIHCRIGIISYI